MAGKRLGGKRELKWFGLALAGSILGVLSSLAGCGGSGEIARYDLSGEILFDGKPVPQGYLQFAPDRKQGNSGPGTSATIMDGRYQTVEGLGIIGGPHIVKITGTDGIPYKTEDGLKIPIGRKIFPEYEVRVDFPRESSTHTFEVPVPQGKGTQKKKGG
jgi:hypothetical protein